MQMGILLSFLVVILGFGSMQAHTQSLSAAEAASRAQSETGGRVLKVKPPKSGGNDYRVRVLLPEGRVRNIIVDGNSGEISYRNKVTPHKHDGSFNESPNLMQGFNNAPASR